MIIQEQNIKNNFIIKLREAYLNDFLKGKNVAFYDIIGSWQAFHKVFGKTLGTM